MIHSPLFKVLAILMAVVLSSCGGSKKKEPPVKEETEVAKAHSAKAVAASAHNVDPHWTYVGSTGPSKWGELSDKFKLCSTGKTQSPVDLVWQRPTVKSTLGIKYESSPWKITNNGHTIQIDMQGKNTVSVDGKVYMLEQFHFHSPSEHKVSGKLYDMEIHFVNKDAGGGAAVLGVFIVEGKENKAIKQLWSLLGVADSHGKAGPGTFNPGDLIPEKRTHYGYKGSLTTPPCSEGLAWNVFNTPITLSSAQIKMFTKLYSGNRRPVQLLNDRKTSNY